MIWFTSDTHYFHANIIDYCYRPFDRVDLMNEKMIENWNTVVAADDIVYHLGDFGFGPTSELIKIRQELNGKIHLVEGNHDRRALRDPVFRNCFESINPLLGITIEDEEMDCEQPIVLCHYPIESWDKAYHGSWHLHGHSHGNVPSSNTQARIDVGVDCWDFTPISYNKVKEAMTLKVFKPKNR